jgi:biotin-dependent carboxylase-like uncharacterized protein
MSEGDHNVKGLKVLRPGVRTTIQDLGRFGYAGHGLSQGGSMDLQAHCWANRLLDNSVNQPTLEVAIGMASFRAECDLMLAIAGADMQAELDGEPIGNWRSFAMRCGQILRFKPAQKGMRAYLATKSGFQAAPVLGSCSTVERNRLGFILREGDVLPAQACHHVAVAYVPPRYVPDYPEAIELRVIESYQASQFCSDALVKFYQEDYRVTPDSDRMGVRLEGGPITPPSGGVISEGIALGAIQIPPDGQPIVLLNDRQTLGGYPKLGVVARVDLPQLCQARPATRIRFAPVSIEQARVEWLEFCDYFSV